MPQSFTDNVLLNNESGLNYAVWWTTNLGFEGTMRALFSVLFGASSILLIRKLEERKKIQSPAIIYYRRLFWLFVFGLINAYILLWTGDILYTYAVAGIFVFPLRKLKPFWLLLLGLFILLISTGLVSLVNYGENLTRLEGEKAIAAEQRGEALNTEQKEVKKEWTEFRNRNHPDTLIKVANESIREMSSSGYFSLVKGLFYLNIEIQTTLLISFSFWDSLGLFLIGMAFFKWKILTGELPIEYYWFFLIVGYGLGFYSGHIYFSSLINARFDQSLLTNYMPWDLYQLKRLFMCLGHISLIILFYKYGLFKKAFNTLAKVGQMAFTNYLMQSVLCALIFYGFGLGLFGKLERYQLYFIMIGIWIIQIIFSNYWLKHHRYGPLEWIWRSLIYWRKQPNKKVEIQS